MENKILLEDYIEVVKTINQLKIKNKTFLITGSSGTLAKFLINSLLMANKLNNSNNKIIAISRDKNKINKIFKNKKIICKNYNDKIDNRFDYIIHFASPTQSKYFTTNPCETFCCIYNLTDKFLKLAKKNKSKFIYVSSMEAYGYVKDNKPKKENELGDIPINNSRSSYSLGKRLAEALCYFYYKQYNTDAVIARLAQTFGAGVNSNDERLFNYALNCVLNDKDIVLTTNGQSYGNYIYLSDAIIGLLYILKKGKSGETYNLCSNNSNIKIIDFCKLMANKKVSVLCNIGQNYYPKNTKLNMSNKKIKKLGWKPTYNVKSSINRFKHYIKQS